MELAMVSPSERRTESVEHGAEESERPADQMTKHERRTHAHAHNRVRSQRTAVRLLLFVCGNDAAAAMRTLPVALLEVGARVSDLFTTVLARYRDMLLFRHTAYIRESCLECILGSAGGAKS